MTTAVANPRVTLNIVPGASKLGPEDHRNLIVGQIAADATVTAGALLVDLPRTDAEINELFGAGSHLAFLARWYRRINAITNVDVIPLADDDAASKGHASAVFDGTATREGTLYVTVAGPDHRYRVDMIEGETPADLLSKLAARVAADNSKPFTFATSGTPVDTGTWTAVNGGNISDDWPLVIEGRVPGITWVLSGWTGGATDPDLTGVFDVVADVRYQGIVWPSAYDRATLKDFIDPRRNVENDIKDGVGFVGCNLAFTAAKAAALALNTSEIVLLGNEPNALDDRKGPHLPEAPDLTAAYTCAVRALRFEDGRSISHLVVTREPRDQFGGMHTASLPYFNTGLVNSRLPARGTGFIAAEQLELEQSGVAVVGMNRAGNGLVLGPLVTTRLNDAAGNAETGDRYLEWRDTKSIIREYQVLNIRKEFAQHRMSVGDGVPGYAMLTEPDVRAYIMELLDDLAEQALVVKGRAARQWMAEQLVVDFYPERRRVQVAERVVMVSQFGEMIGSIGFVFNTN
jgi:phage tail sheath gpL-like